MFAVEENEKATESANTRETRRAHYHEKVEFMHKWMQEGKKSWKKNQVEHTHCTI